MAEYAMPDTSIFVEDTDYETKCRDIGFEPSYETVREQLFLLKKAIACKKEIAFLRQRITDSTVREGIYLEEEELFHSIPVALECLELTEYVSKQQQEKIAAKGMTGEYEFLTNDFSCAIHYGNFDFGSATEALQVLELQSKNWDKEKNKILYKVLFAKITQNPDFSEKLMGVNVPFVWENNCHDNELGVCICEDCKGRKGKNTLGKTLSVIRDQLVLFNT